MLDPAIVCPILANVSILYFLKTQKNPKVSEDIKWEDWLETFEHFSFKGVFRAPPNMLYGISFKKQIVNSLKLSIPVIDV